MGAVQDTVAEPSPAVALTPVGAPGGVAPEVGVTGLVAVEAAPVPMALVAVTVVRPVTVVLVAGGVPVTVLAVCAVPPMNGVTVYPVIWLPPLEGAVQDTVAEPSPAVAATPVGA